MARFNASAEKALRVIAHLTAARAMAKDLPDMDGFAEFYLERLPAEEKAIVKRFEALCQKAFRDLATELAEELEAFCGR